MRISRRAMLAAIPVLSLAPRVHATAQDAGPGAGELMRQGRYLPRWIELLDEPGERARIAASLGPDQADYVDWILRDGVTQYAAMIGNEPAALAAAPQPRRVPDPASDLVAMDAIEAIVEASRGHRVVMLNEAHCASRHRAFLGQLLPALRAEGFTHLAAEAFAEAISEVRAGDALTMRHGFYIADPVYAEAVRSALEQGYRLTPYEQRADQRGGDAALSDSATLLREQVQANNLKAVMQADPAMRVLVFVGYGHLSEEGPQFGARFKADTDIDPLTIGQSGTGAFGPHVEDVPAVRALLEHFQPEKPVVLLKAGQRPRSADSIGALTAEGTDLLVLHPASPDIDGRPAWLAGDPGRRRLEVPIPAGQGPRLLQARHAADPDEAIPADQFLAPEGGGGMVMYLRPGRYRLGLETETGFTPLGEASV